MTANEFQIEAHKFSDYPTPIIYEDFHEHTRTNLLDYAYPAMALAEEAGEVAGKYAKAIRDCNGRIDAERREAIKKELGDVLWFVAELSTQLDFTLEEVMAANIEKLTSRKARGVIKGDGDDR
jgi:NTP pyrophosphatase (non-canonical NTP hydrolase)